MTFVYKRALATAIATTGVFSVEDYFDCLAKSDKRANQVLLGNVFSWMEEANHEDVELAMEMMKKKIETSQEYGSSLSSEKLVLATQAHDLIESHVKRHDEDLNQFTDDLKQEGKILPDDSSILPPLPLVSRDEKHKGGYITPQSKCDIDIDLIPPPGSHERNVPCSVDVDQPIDPNEPTYCVCHQVSFGDMIACDNENCEGGEWFHFACVGLTPETKFKAKWFCPTCRNQ